MVKKEEKKTAKWYDSGNAITSLIIGLILIIIICSQSFAVGGENSLVLFGSVINHNTVYLLVLIYFIFLKTKFGKRYFNYLNVFLVFVYCLVTLTSMLTLVATFTLETVLIFIINCIILLYLFHTMFRDTRIWKDYKLSSSPFNEINNDSYFGSIIFLSGLLLVVNLMNTLVVSGIVLAILDAIYMVLFGRYIYLYAEYLNYYKKGVTKSSLDGIKGNVMAAVDDTMDKVDKIVEEQLDKKVEVVAKKLEDFADDAAKEVEELNKKISKTKKTSKKKGDKQ